jgi:hypothetical protein
MKIRRLFLSITIAIFMVFSLSLVTDDSFAYWASSIGSSNDSVTGTASLGIWDFSQPIYTTQEFYDFATSSTSSATDKYHLANDLDFSSFTWDYNSSYDSNTFKGEFDGRDYTLSNITVTSSDTSSVRVSIFSQIDGATIKNVTVDNFKMGFSNWFFNNSDLEASVFASNVKNAGNLIENITLNDVELIANTKNGAGGLVTTVKGGADLIIRNIKATDVTVLNEGKRSGGLISRILSGSGTVIIEDIDFQGFVASDSKRSNTGGILGTSASTTTSITRAIVEYTAKGTVTLSNTSITYKSNKYTGGFLGNNNNTIGIDIIDSFYTGILYENTSKMGSAVGLEKETTTNLVNTYYSNVMFNTTTTEPTNTTGIHATLVSAIDLNWWNNFASVYYSANSLWQQDGTGRLELIR